ncbi:hypothetical protein LP420_00415 [Massilia sp. B-10]|nr:hypothetical protein LP420_00415 [Massilia sp. B-10]
MQPRLNWKLADGDQLNAGGFLQSIRTDTAVSAEATNLIGSFAAPDYLSLQPEQRRQHPLRGRRRQSGQ